MSAPKWRTSSRCSSGGCVEVKVTEKAVLVRNSTDPQAGELVIPTTMWRDLVATIKTGELDRR